MKKIALALKTLLIFTPLFAFASFGAVDGIWFSSQEVVEGQSARVYVAVYNQENQKISGKITFFANGEKIKSVPFSVPAQSIRSFSILFEPKEANTMISARITSSGKTQTLSPKLLVMLKDTDKDGIPDEEDEDDDNDGISDKEELAQGTDPLVKNKSSDSDSLIPPTLKKYTRKAKETAEEIKEKIDPYAISLASKAKQKAQELESKQSAQSFDTSSLKATVSSIANSEIFNTLSAKALLALAFVLNHWSWHLIAAMALVLLHKIFKIFVRKDA